MEEGADRGKASPESARFFRKKKLPWGRREGEWKRSGVSTSHPLPERKGRRSETTTKRREIIGTGKRRVRRSEKKGINIYRSRQMKLGQTASTNSYSS